MSEEQKAIKRLEEMKENYSLNGEDLHYVNILYYLIINLQKENRQLKNDNAVMIAGLIQVSNKQLDLYKEIIEEVREYLKGFDIERLHETYEHNLVNVIEYLLQMLDKVKEGQ